MAYTFANLQADVQGATADTSADSLTRFKRFLNRAGADFWYRWPWPWRAAQQFVSTTAPYTTGTISTSGTTVTGSGTTFPTMTASTRKLALAYTSPWYTIASRDSATQLTLDRSYVESAASGSAFVVYQDLYSLASTVETVLEAEVIRHTTGGANVARLFRRDAEGAYPFPSGAGTPEWWTLHGYDSSGNVVIRLGSLVPDSVWSIRLGVLTRYTEMSADGDFCVVPDRYRHILVYGALREAFLLYGDDQRALTWGNAFEQAMVAAWSRESTIEPQTYEMRGFDSPAQPIWHRGVLPVTQ